YEEQKAQTRSVPLQTLRDLIHQRTEKVLENLRESPMGRLIPGQKEAGVAQATVPEKTEKSEGSTRPEAGKPSLVEQARETFEEFQHRVDERVRALLPNLTPWQQLQNEVKRLAARVEELEKRLGEKK